MATPNNWPQAQGLGDWMRGQEKRMMREERRPRVQSASDLLGPGFGPHATTVTDWNSEAARFNGFFHSDGSASNTPAPAVVAWHGLTVSVGNHGVQMLWSHATPVRTFVRNFHIHELSTPTYGPWQEVVGGSVVAYLNELTDVDTAGVLSDHVLRFNGTLWVAGAVPTHGHTKAQITDFAHVHTITDLPVANSGEVSTTGVVRADDSRLSDARTPTTHAHGPSDTNSGFQVARATTTNITLSGHQAIDGTTTVEGEAILVRFQSTAANNGVYVASSGAWTRHPLFATAADLAAAVVRVRSGTTHGGQTWTTGFRSTDTLGTSNITWQRILDTGQVGTPVAVTGTTQSVGTTASVSRSNHQHGIDFAGDGVVSATKPVRADDLRLSNARTPTAHAHPLGELTAGTLAPPLTMAEQATAPASPAAAGTGILYVFDGQPYFTNDAGKTTMLTEVPTVVSDGIAASGSITLTPIGGIGSLFFRWTEATSADPVTYKLYVRAGQAPTATDTYLVAQGSELTFASVRNVEGVKVDASGATVYYALVTGADIDTPAGSEVVSNTVTAVPAQINSPDIAAGVVAARLIAANEGFIDVLNATSFTGVTITGPTIQTGTNVAQTGGIRLTERLLEAFSPSGGAPFFSVDPAAGMALVAGTINSLKLTVSGKGSGSSLGGPTEFPVNAVATLALGTTAPTAGPSTAYDWASTQFTSDQSWPQRKGFTTDGTYWYTFVFVPNGTSTIERWTADGIKDTAWAIYTTTSSSESTGVVFFKGHLYRAGRAGTGDWTMYRYAVGTSGITGTFGTPITTQGHVTSLAYPSLGIDPSADSAAGHLLLYGIHSSHKVRVNRYRPGDVGSFGMDRIGFEDSTDTWTQGKYGTSDGAFGGLADFGAYRVVIPIRYGVDTTVGGTHTILTSWTASQTPPNTATMARQVNEEWVTGTNNPHAGLSFAGGVFRSMDNTGLLRTYTGLWTTNAQTYEPVWVSNTLAYSATSGANATPDYETTQSPKTYAFNGANGTKQFPKRARLLVTTSPIPARVGAQDPDRVRIFLGRGTTEPVHQSTGASISNAMVLAVAPAEGIVTASITSWPTSSTQPPTTSSGFPGQTAAKVSATAGGFSIDGSSNGSVGTGTFRTSVDDRVRAVAPPLIGANRRVIGKSVAQAVPTGTATLLTFDTTHASTGTDVPTYTSGGTVITVPTAGVYSINFGIQWAAGGTGINFSATLHIAGVARAGHVAQFSGSGNARVTQNYGSWTGFLAANSQVRLEGFHHHGSDLGAQPGWAVSAGNAGTFVEVTKIS